MKGSHQGLSGPKAPALLRDSEVTGPANTRIKVPVLILKRLDGETFPLVQCSNVFYVLLGDSKLELVNIESIAFKSLDLETSGGMRSLFARGQPEVQWCVKYTRCFCMLKAIKHSTTRDHVAKNANDVNRPASLGKKSLQKLLKQEDSRLIFHRGDYPYETAAKNTVGFVGWDSAVSKAANSNFKDVLQNINAHTKFPVLNPADMDWVDCGQDFSEHVPRE
jgi:hypothetical protein